MNTIATGEASPSSDVYNNFELAYQHFNEELFDGQLPSCVITVQRKANTFGYFSANRWGAFIRGGNVSDNVVAGHQKTSHEIALNPAYFAGRPLIEVFQTLVHEQAHLWQHEFGKPSIKAYHNKEWADKMEAIGLMPSDTGKPGGKRTGQQMMDYPARGGRFMNACVSLIENGFKLPWIDRAFVQNRMPINIPSELAVDAAPGEVEEATSIDGYYEGVLYTLIENNEPIAIQSSTNSKALHVCPRCNQRCWGKPSLNVVCGKCKIKLRIPTEQTSQVNDPDSDDVTFE